LRAYDYAQVGAYFITIVTHKRVCLFGEIIDGGMRINRAGSIAQWTWAELPKHFRGIKTDQFVIMPNHIHGIIHITNIVVGAQHAAPAKSHVQSASLGAIVRSFKSAVSKRCKEQAVIPGATIWQRNYYDHVIRNENELIRIREYIATNPLRWSLDPENPLQAQAEPKDSSQSFISDCSNARAQHAAPLRNVPKV
jgi:REP element-mobilizing transposase RayT